MSDDNADNPDCLHLFTSTIRELYIADAVNLLAAPTGAHYRFRYEGRYVEEKTRREWQESRLDGLPVFVYFSIQHIADFHPAIYVPLREGEVAYTIVEGDTYAVYFRLGNYLPLDEDLNWTDLRERKAPVREFTSSLRKLLDGRDPDNRIHAVLDKSSEALCKSTGNQGRDFETIVRYLTPSLLFSPRIYYRIASIERESDRALVELSPEGNVHLDAGEGYTINVAHYQQQAPAESVRVGITTPQGLNIVGDSEIEFSSRYDVIPVRVFPPFRDDVISGELAFKTSEPALGPTVRLPIIVSPKITHSLSGPALGVAGALALALPAALATSNYLPLKIVLIATGSAAAAIGLWWRRAKGLSG